MPYMRLRAYCKEPPQHATGPLEMLSNVSHEACTVLLKISMHQAVYQAECSGLHFWVRAVEHGLVATQLSSGGFTLLATHLILDVPPLTP